MRPRGYQSPRIRRAVVDLAWAHPVWDGDGQQAGTPLWPDRLRVHLGVCRGETLPATALTLTILAP
jgi:hypothetical protein